MIARVDFAPPAAHVARVHRVGALYVAACECGATGALASLVSLALASVVHADYRHELHEKMTA